MADDNRVIDNRRLQGRGKRLLFFMATLVAWGVLAFMLLPALAHLALPLGDVPDPLRQFVLPIAAGRRVAERLLDVLVFAGIGGGLWGVYNRFAFHRRERRRSAKILGKVGMGLAKSFSLAMEDVELLRRARRVSMKLDTAGHVSECSFSSPLSRVPGTSGEGGLVLVGERLILSRHARGTKLCGRGQTPPLPGSIGMPGD